MKKAFTMMEVITVIAVIGVLVAVAIPRSGSNRLSEAATQLISHIRYTQHLAMIDDKFDATDSNWYKERWTLRFKKDLVYNGSYIPNGTYENEWAYTIFSDRSHDGNPNPSEMAKNTLNTNQYLSGGYNNTLHVENAESMKKLRLGSAYGINNVTFGGGCRSNILYINFDHLGRPFNSIAIASAYEIPASGWHKLLTSRCTITLNNDDGNIIVGIEPETGYSCILDNATNECI